MDYLDSQLSTQIIMTIVTLIAYVFIVAAINSALSKYGIIQKVLEQRLVYLKKIVGLLMLLVLAISVAVIWGIDLKAMIIFTSSLFAVVGVGLFASWSILSNLTSSMILMFSFPYKIGDRIRIVDRRFLDQIIHPMLVPMEKGRNADYHLIEQDAERPPVY